MATFKELGLKVGDLVNYHPYIKGANWGPSYSGETATSTVVGVAENTVYIHPPHVNSMELWLIQNADTGEIVSRSIRTSFFRKRRVEEFIALKANERHVEPLIASDPYRFVPRTWSQWVKTLPFDTFRAITRATDNYGRVVHGF